MKKNNGFTLIEFIIYAGLTSMLIALMSQVFLATLGIRTESQNTTNIEQDGRYMVSRMTYDIRRAKSIDAPVSGQTQSTMTLTISENGVDTVQTYALQGTELILIEGTDSAKLHSDGSLVRVATFTRIEDTLNISLIIDGAGDITIGTQSLKLRTAVGIR